MRFAKLALIAGCLVCLTTVIPGDTPRVSADDKPVDRDRWMAAKLTSSQQILEDLTRGDFEGLETSARRMQFMNFLEQWLQNEDFEKRSEYQGQLNAFEFSTKELIRYAGDEDMDGALKSYTAMTETCVRCHSLIRDAE